MSKRRFAMVSEAMLSDERLTGRQFKVLCALRLFASSDTGMAHPKRSQLTELIGVAESKISDDTRALELFGWITRSGDGGRSTSNVYVIFDEPTNVIKPTPKQGALTHPKTGEVKTNKPTPKWELTYPEMGCKPTPKRGVNLPRNGEGQVTDHKQTSNRPLTDHLQNTPATAVAVATKKKVLSDNEKQVCRETWEAYATGYFERYGIDPVRNAKVSKQVVDFCKRVPQAEAPSIARFFVASNSSFYVGRGHQFGNLLADAEKMRTEWATGRSMTTATARQIDSTQSNFNAIEQALSMSAERKLA
jgi:hypothetical protein